MEINYRIVNKHFFIAVGMFNQWLNRSLPIMEEGSTNTGVGLFLFLKDQMGNFGQEKLGFLKSI